MKKMNVKAKINHKSKARHHVRAYTIKTIVSTITATVLPAFGLFRIHQPLTSKYTLHCLVR